jgi:two-component sensor histidine kinase
MRACSRASSRTGSGTCFSVINAVTALTARHERAPWMAEKLNDRISALGRAYEATLDQAHRRRVMLSDVVRMVLEPYATAGDDERILIEGDEVILDPNAVSTLGLTLHELATDSIRHGALGAEGGRVLVSWQFAGAAANADLSLTWRERG